MFEFKTILEFTKKFGTKKQCEKFLIEKRFGGKIQCVYCNHNKVCKVADGRYKCSKCNNKFSIKVGTVFEGSKLGLDKWFMAIYFLTCSAKGISSNQLGKELGVSQKSAWFMLHRLREVLNGSQKKNMFGGTVEIDECYVGGSESNKHTVNKFKSEKTAVIGMVERETKQAKAFVVENADKENLLPKIGCNVKEKSVVITDSYHAYNDLRSNDKHKSIKHSANEYVKNELDIDGRVAFKVHTNTVEGFWSIVKRTVNGTHHWISKKHTTRYLNDMTFRYNQRQLNSQNNFDVFTSSFDGRLKYVELTKSKGV
jgi:transposase-like protein